MLFPHFLTSTSPDVCLPDNPVPSPPALLTLILSQVDPVSVLAMHTSLLFWGKLTRYRHGKSSLFQTITFYKFMI